MFGKNAMPIIKDCENAMPICIPIDVSIIIQRYFDGRNKQHGTKTHSNKIVNVLNPVLILGC